MDRNGAKGIGGKMGRVNQLNWREVAKQKIRENIGR